MKKMILVFMVIMSVSLCGCSINNNINTEESGQNETAQNKTEESGQNETAQNKIEESGQNETIQNETEKISMDEKDTTKNEMAVQEALLYGGIGELGTGYLVYVISGQESEDYKLYFVESEDNSVALSEVDFNLEEADYIFPDVREGNAAIGEFSEIYFLDMTDMTGNGRAELLVIAIYERDGNKYFDTRVYEIKENGVSANDVLIQELNEKYSDAEDYPIEEIVMLPHD